MTCRLTFHLPEMNELLPADLKKSPTLNLTWLLWWSLITSFKLCIILLLDGWGWWSLGEVNIWVLSDYNGPRFSTLGLTSKSFKNRFHPQIKFQTYFFLFLHKLTASAPSLHYVVYHHHDHDQIKRWYVTKVAWTRAGVDMALFLSLPSHLWKLTSTVCALYSYYSCTIAFFHNW